MEIVSYARSARRDARPPPAAPSPAAGIAPASPTAEGERVDWVDIAKGICIVLVVTMHSTLGVEAALGREGFMHWAVAFAKPFRLPDFFLVSGLFLGRVIDRDWRLYADKRVVHFAYFYLLWLLIQSGVKFGQVSDGSVAGFARHLAHSLVEPFSTLWFVYALAVFSIATKLLRRLPGPLLLGLAATLQILPINTSSDFLNKLCERWVYFVAGYLFAPHVFRLAGWARSHAAPALAGLLAWAFANGALALAPIDRWGATTFAELPVISLLAGLAGAVAVTVTAALIARSPAGRPARYLGSKSLAVYLTFFLPMVFLRLLLSYVWPAGDAGAIALVVTLGAVLFPLLAEVLARGTRLSFLYVRPGWAHLKPREGAPKARPPAAKPAPAAPAVPAAPEGGSSGIDLSRALRPYRAGAAWQSEHSPSTSTAREPGLNPTAAAVSETPRATSSEATSSTLPQVVQTRKIVAA